MREPNKIGTVKFSISVDANTGRILNELVRVGLRGRTRSEVAYGILKEWLWHNQDALGRNRVYVDPQRSGGKKQVVTD